MPNNPSDRDRHTDADISREHTYQVIPVDSCPVQLEPVRPVDPIAPSEEAVRDMLILAGRLKESTGGELDDAAIMAVAEATGTTPEYVRIALRAHTTEEQEEVRVGGFRKFLLAFDPDVRRWVVGGILGGALGMLAAIAAVFGDPYSLIGILSIVAVGGVIYNCGQSKDARTASVAGAVAGAVGFTSQSIFLAILSLMWRAPSAGAAGLIIPLTLGGALAGLVSFKIFGANRGKLGFRDPVSQRQDLLRQLVELQDRLKSHERNVTFLTVDMVGSTKQKEDADPLAVEYTFNEYHAYIEGVARKHGGQVHATAGDGVICAFDLAESAFKAARNMQAALIEFNTHRNRLGKPVELRVGIHSGQVLAEDVQRVNFAHVIDISAHLQRVCPVGGVAVSDATAAQIPGGATLIGTEKVAAQGVAATIWFPKHIESGTALAPPPLPTESA
ncbi:MAG: hypothetical protein HONBIEJF_00835 [Fimbriimonadaceae bacterium]|nr:hypothetical protein [Fimbriimonadaceae bacterium]